MPKSAQKIMPNNSQSDRQTMSFIPLPDYPT
jgi:hypothetical protein